MHIFIKSHPHASEWVLTDLLANYGCPIVAQLRHRDNRWHFLASLLSLAQSSSTCWCILGCAHPFSGKRLCSSCLNPIEHSISSRTSCTAVFTLSCPHPRPMYPNYLRCSVFHWNRDSFFSAVWLSRRRRLRRSALPHLPLFLSMSVCLCLLIKIQRRHNGSRPMLCCEVRQTNFFDRQPLSPFSPAASHCLPNKSFVCSNWKLLFLFFYIVIAFSDSLPGQLSFLLFPYFVFLDKHAIADTLIDLNAN